MDGPDFDTLWRQCSGQVYRHCRRYTQAPAEADEVCQRVAIRAWRHFPTLRDPNAFPTWVLSITRRELARWADQRGTERNRVTALPAEDFLPASKAGPGQGAEAPGQDGSAWLHECIDEATRQHHLTALEAAVLKQRLAGNESWAATAARLGLDANRVAVTHCRAVPKLRVFLFLRRQEALGGAAALRAAFDQAQQQVSTRLTDAEALVFDRIILRGQHKFRPTGWALDLRAACAKVARHLPAASI